MLVLGIKRDQSFEVWTPEGIVKIKFLHCSNSGKQIWVGVEAPQCIQIQREGRLPRDETEDVRDVVAEMEKS